MALRNANLPAGALINRLSLFEQHLSDSSRQAQANPAQVEVRFSYYPIPETLTIVDAEGDRSSESKMIVRLSGFQIPFQEKLDFSASRRDNEKTYNHFLKEFKNIYLAASKFIVITGRPRSGKLSFVEKLISTVDRDSRIYHTVSKSIWTDAGNRIGFEVMTSNTPQPRKFATRKADEQYTVDRDVWSKIATELRHAHVQRKLLVIDEIGPMQLESENFRQLVIDLLDDRNSHVIATVYKDQEHDPIIGKIFQSARSKIIDIEGEQDIDLLQRKMREEVAGSEKWSILSVGSQ
jgi:nucleoside-triphosphatase THEP1